MNTKTPFRDVSSFVVKVEDQNVNRAQGISSKQPLLVTQWVWRRRHIG